jgi:hypothetical protein
MFQYKSKGFSTTNNYSYDIDLNDDKPKGKGNEK